MKILFLPVDSRPCNSLFAGQLLKWCGAECIQLPKEVQDHFTTPSDWEGVKRFLEEHAAEADVFAISLDQLCFGSLLASREIDITEEQVRERLDWFEALQAKYPDKPVHAVNTILRTSISTLRTNDLNVYHAMTDYSYWSDKASVTGSMEDLAKSEYAARQIPTELIQKYHAVRKRNHLLNSWAVDLVKRGVLSSLLLLMEDSEEYGFHRTEQRVLQDEINGDKRILIKNGTDEGPLLCMKCLAPFDLSVALEWVGRDDGQFIARYEDRPFAENVAHDLEYLGITVDQKASTVLAIAANEEGIQGDLVMTSLSSLPTHYKSVVRAATQLNELIAEGRSVYLLDEYVCNGGWPELMKRIEHPEKLAGYSAWNTASNALGTIIGEICSNFLAGKVNTSFRNERFLDDLLYESCVRYQLNLMLRADGDDPYHLSDPSDAERRLRELFDQLFNQQGNWTRRYAGIVNVVKEAGSYRVSFPWQRTFEVEAHQD